MFLRLHILSFLLYSVFKVHLRWAFRSLCTSQYIGTNLPSQSLSRFPSYCGGPFAPSLLLSAWVRSPPLLAVPSGFGLLLSAILIAAYNPRELPPAQPVVGSSGLEPPTSRLSGVRSNHLSYEPISVAVRGLAIYRPTCVFALNSFFPRSPLPEIRRLHRVPAI